jgi:hypothetical protein
MKVFNSNAEQHCIGVKGTENRGKNDVLGELKWEVEWPEIRNRECVDRLYSSDSAGCVLIYGPFTRAINPDSIATTYSRTWITRSCFTHAPALHVSLLRVTALSANLSNASKSATLAAAL